VSPDAVLVGAGAHGFDKHRLTSYRDAVVDATEGAELATIVSDLEAGGHEIGGETHKRVPRGYAADGIGERLLRHSALFVHTELPAESASSTKFIDTVLTRWRAFVRLHGWLVANVQR
jgi:Conserved hypothetical protein (DUF2461)